MNENEAKKNFWTFFISNYRLTYVILIGIIVFGVLSIITIPKESSPEIDIPVIVITTTLPGASALDVEELVTDEIESKVQGLPDIDSMTSNSAQGFSQIVLSFDVDSDGREKLTDVRERITRVDLPNDASNPSVQQISFSDRPILTFALAGPFSPIELKDYAETLRDEIEKIDGVSQVNVVGAPERQIEVVLRQDKLNQFGLSVSQVSAAISQSNLGVPIGSIETAGGVYAVRFDGRVANATDIEETAIALQGNFPVFVKDVAEVKDTFSRPNTLTRMSLSDGGPESSVTVQVFKLSGQGDILSIVDQVNENIAQARLTILPEGLNIKVIEDDAELISKDLSNLVTSGLLTMSVVLLVLIIFLGWKEAIIASLVVPLTFLFTFIFLGPLGYTINFLTLFSLILALGILVDASIVVTEGMFNKIKEGLTPQKAAYATIHEFKAPLIAGTLTTVFVFLPMTLTSGIIGKFIESIPITITIVLTGAIFVSLAVVPTLGVRFLKPSGQNGSNHGLALVQRWIAQLYAWYGIQISKFVDNWKKGRRFLFIVLALFFVALALPAIGIVKVNMFPAEDSEIIYVDVNNPVGTPLTVTDAQISDLEARLLEDERVESLLATVGSGSNAGSLTAGQNNSHQGSIIINLVEDRKQSSLEIVADLEQALAGLVEAEVEVSQLASGPEQGSPVQVNIKGGTQAELNSAALTLSELLSNIEGTRNVSDGIEENSGEFTVTIDRSQARSFGVSPAQIATVIRSAVAGDTTTTIKSGGDDIDVNVVYNIGAQYSEVGSVPKIGIGDLRGILIPTARGNVPLSVFADIALNNSNSSINHDDGDRTIIVSSGIEDGANVGVIVAQIQQRLGELVLPDDIVVTFGGEAEDIAESFTSLGQAMIIGVMMIFGLLIWQFKSYRQPLFVLVTIPLALIGVMLGLALTAQPLSFPGFIGVVALAGIVVNNAIILIDSINNSRRSGLAIPAAVKESAKSRLQPIILTTVTTVAGMMPLAFTSPTWAPLAYSIIFGLSFATVLTLFVVPILYSRFGEAELDQTT